METQENKTKKEYLAIRRKHFLWVTFSFVLFGATLYFASIFSDYAQKNEIETLDDVKKNIVGILKNDFAIFPLNDSAENEENNDEKEDKSKNILNAPLLLSCSVENNRAFVKEPFKVAKYKVTDAVFKLASHGKTIYSSGFSSKEKTVFCRGTLKEGQQKIFVYYCEKI